MARELCCETTNLTYFPIYCINFKYFLNKRIQRDDIYTNVFISHLKRSRKKIVSMQTGN